MRDAGDPEDYVVTQVRSALSRVDGAEGTSVIVAYEPVWAIGETGSPASPEQVAPVMRAIRETVAEQLVGPSGPVLYGGSVEESNAVALLEGAEADGLFVGRAAWSASGFGRLLAVCAAQPRRHSTPDRIVR